MIRKLLLVGAAALAGAAALSAVLSVSAQDGPPPPSAGTTLASGLPSTGATIGPDGALYVALGGTGGDEEIALLPEVAAEVGAESAFFGLTGSVARVDTTSGEVTTAADGLPSLAFGEPGEGSGATDVAFLGDTMYVLITGGANYIGQGSYPNGVYRLNADETWTVIADLSEFADDNPVTFPDAAPGGNPFAIDVRGSEFIVSDGNYNRLLTVTQGGAISILASFENVVPTGLETSASGPVLNTWFSAAPHNPGESFLVSVAVPTGGATQIADTYAQLIDVEFGPGGNTYVLQFGDQSLDENAPPPPGRLLLLDGSELLPVVEGLLLATSVNFSGDTAFVTSLTGEVWAIDGVSGLTPVAPEPTVAPPPVPTVPVGTVTPPDTGSGGDSSPVATPWLAIVLLAAAGASCAALAKVPVRR